MKLRSLTLCNLMKLRSLTLCTSRMLSIYILLIQMRAILPNLKLAQVTCCIVISFSVATCICIKQTKILCRQLNCSVKLANVLIRCSSHPQGRFYRTIKLYAENLCLFHTCYTVCKSPCILDKKGITNFCVVSMQFLQKLL